MDLYIRIKNGLPYEHPILGENLRLVFPNIDLNNLPEEFAKFERVQIPNISAYQIIEKNTYEWVDNIVKDVWYIRDMTEEEKIIKQNKVKDDWINRGIKTIPPELSPELWVFDEETCSFKQPLTNVVYL